VPSAHQAWGRRPSGRKGHKGHGRACHVAARHHQPQKGKDTARDHYLQALLTRSSACFEIERQDAADKSVPDTPKRASGRPHRFRGWVEAQPVCFGAMCVVYKRKKRCGSKRVHVLFLSLLRSFPQIADPPPYALLASPTLPSPFTHTHSKLKGALSSKSCLQRRAASSRVSSNDPSHHRPRSSPSFPSSTALDFYHANGHARRPRRARL